MSNKENVCVVTFLVGNGFDLGMKMKSGYTDFYNLYIDNKSPYYPHNNPWLADMIRLEKEKENQPNVQDTPKKHNAMSAPRHHWSYYEGWFGDLTREYDNENECDKDGRLSCNEKFQEKFYHYLKDREEKMIFAISESDLNKEMIYEYSNDGMVQAIIKDDPERKVIFSISKDDLAKEKTDIETILKGESGAYLGVKGKYQKVRDLMKNALQSFYSAKNIGSESHRTVLRAIINALNSNQSGQNSSSVLRFQFVCYNYSGVLKNCVKTIKAHPNDLNSRFPVTFGKVHHVHGALRNAAKAALVMGVNDDNQIGPKYSKDGNGKYRHRLIKKDIMNRKYNGRQYKIAERMIKESNVIVVYGMSLGSTDKDYWKMVYQWLDDQTHHLIFYIFDNEYEQLNPYSHTDITEKWMRSFREMVWPEASYCTKAENRPCFQHDKCPKSEECDDWYNREKRIHFAIDRNIFAMDLWITPKADDH